MCQIQDKDIRNVIKKYIDDSYLPVVILDANQSRLAESYLNKPGLENDRLFRSLTSEVQCWIATTVSTGVYYNSATTVQSAVLDRVWDFFSDVIFPGRKITKLKKEACKYISTAEREYHDYVLAHEESLNKVQAQIDVINRKKPLMKEYILQKVADRLSSLGIKSEVSDYPMESLDMRKFGLNEEFGDIRKTFQEIQTNTYTKFLENLPGVPFGFGSVVYVLVSSRIRQLEEQIIHINNITGLVFEKMRSDNQKVDNLYKALKNIAEIFTDITNRFIPTIEKILDLIRSKYHDTLSEIPDDVLCLLRSVTMILKALSEKSILPKTERDELIESTISTSNNISVEYEKLRKIMTDAA